MNARVAAGPAGTVAELWRYPVKSMGGERVQRAEVRPVTGIDGDRVFAARDEATGRILSAKREGRLLLCAARTAGADVLVRFPSGAEAAAGSAECDAELSAFLERDVTLHAATAGEVSEFERALTPEPDSTVEVMRTQPGSFFDTKSALHLLTVESLASAARLVPDARWSLARFRPNLLIGTGSGDYPEDGWLHATMQVGGLRLWVRRETTRCVVPSRAQPGLPAERRIFEAIARQRKNILGVRARPVSTGPVAVGDVISVLGYETPDIVGR